MHGSRLLKLLHQGIELRNRNAKWNLLHDVIDDQRAHPAVGR